MKEGKPIKCREKKEIALVASGIILGAAIAAPVAGAALTAQQSSQKIVVDGRPLAKVYLTIPAEYEAYTPVFWPWRASELEKKAAAVPRGRFWCEAWDAYVDGRFMQTQYYIFVG